MRNHFRRIAVAAACLLSVSLVLGCGADDSETAPKSSAGSSPAATGQSKPPSDRSAGADHSEQGRDKEAAREPQHAEANDTPRQATNRRPKAKPHSDAASSQGNDEEACDSDPSRCPAQPETAVDPSNPDSSDVEQRDDSPIVPRDCDSRDCEKLREEER